MLQTSLNSVSLSHQTFLELYQDIDDPQSLLWVEMILKIGNYFNNVQVKVENWSGCKIKYPHIPISHLYSLRVFKPGKPIRFHFLPTTYKVWCIFKKASEKNRKQSLNMLILPSLSTNMNFEGTSYISTTSKTSKFIRPKNSPNSVYRLLIKPQIPPKTIFKPIPKQERLNTAISASHKPCENIDMSPLVFCKSSDNSNKPKKYLNKV